MKTTQTTSQFFPIMRSLLQAMQLDVESKPDHWHKALQDVINQGAFLKMECGISLAGVIDCRLVLVSNRGDVVPLSQLEG
jgi:hypothetical protein